MPKNTFVLVALLLSLASATSAQTGGPSPPQAPGLSERSVACRVMEVFRAERLGTTAAIFHQRGWANCFWLTRAQRLNSKRATASGIARRLGA